MDMRNLKLDPYSCLLVVYYIYPTSSLLCLPWRDFLGKYRNVYIIYKSWQYSRSITCQVWAKGATSQENDPVSEIFLELGVYN